MVKAQYKMQQRDWVYILILSIVGQFVIYFLAFVYNSSTSALGYISFAGTMVSIILAVIAIGYTYGESIRQKHNEDELIIQIRGLSEIKEKLGDQVDVLEQIADLKKDVNSTRELTISNIQNFIEIMNTQPQSKNEETKSDDFAFLTNMNLVLFSQTAILIYIYDSFEFNDVEGFANLVANYYKDFSTTHEELMARVEGLMAVWTIFNNLNILDEYQYKPKLKEYLKDKISRNEEKLKGLPFEIINNLKL